MNIPRKAESIKPDYISNYQDLSKALKQCAKLKTISTYFTEGIDREYLLTKPLKEFIPALIHCLTGQS